MLQDFIKKTKVTKNNQWFKRISNHKDKIKSSDNFSPKTLKNLQLTEGKCT